ncbi:DUF2442 domain-containing protein [Martelella mediterranea]|uniref:DUF2442 domain-containing protein n=1 Tax=Martelella lutilitoris TaxID=2583532 RepID=A0A7T7HJJ5_9HYPH|nr:MULTISPECIES: DUF2442 domain-containing protein [Martelella]MAU20066.1 hypothetical protein [Martelella sp.]MCD1634114.1 DUF2442 domain-containing protein [Martelella mediterranea]QQM30354.1 DUF2442 domain-containing protein [Martelella lutilitoris]
MTSSDPYPEHERPVAAWCDPAHVHVRLADDREVVTPLWWYPRLLAASPAERNNVELMLDGVHWPDVDEDLSVRGMLSGWKYPNAVEPREVA